MKVTLENFRKIQEYKKPGLSQKKTATNLSLTMTSVRKWWDATADKHLMQTLIDRITANSQIIRLN